MISKQDIQLLSYDELKNELCSRYHSVVFIGQKEDAIDHIDYHYSGGKTSCMGLLDLLKIQIIGDFKNETRKKTNKDE
jgi:hypothetical protein